MKTAKRSAPDCMKYSINQHGRVLVTAKKTAKKIHSRTCLKRPLKNRKNKDLNDKWWLNEGRKYCRILLTCIKQ